MGSLLLPPQGPPQGPYPPQGAYPPPQGAYPPPQGAYPPPQGAYPPPQGAYPPPQGAYPPPQGAYPPPQGGYPPPQGGYPPPPPFAAPTGQRLASLAPNPERGGMRIGLAILLVGAAMIAWPLVTGMDGMKGGFALMFVGGFLGLSGLITAWMFGARAAEVDRMLSGEAVLAHWTVPADVWAQTSGGDAADARATRVATFRILLFWVVVIGGGFAYADPKNALPVVGVLAAVTVVCALLAFRPARGQEGPGEIHISRKAALLGDTLYMWAAPGTWLERIDLEAGPVNSLLFVVTAWTRTGPESVTFRAPIPPGWEGWAQQLAQELMRRD